MLALDWVALIVFCLAWLGYDPLLGVLARKSGTLNADMLLIRQAWMRAMTERQMRLVDAQLMGHTISSASFFASTNLLLIAAVAGVLFGGDAALRNIANLGADAPSIQVMEGKLALIIVCLARGLLDLVWALRQLNYTVALIGATPEVHEEADRATFAQAAARVLNPALSSFNRGVRGYYFALAAAAWMFGAVWLLLAVVAVTALLLWRQIGSPAAQAVRHARRLLDRG